MVLLERLKFKRQFSIPKTPYCNKASSVPSGNKFRTGGGGGPVEFLSFVSQDCTDDSSHMPYVFVVRVVNQTYIVNIAC